MNGQPLAGKVALVTGATRGVGRGIARGLGEAGATVYVTGRTTVEGSAPSRLPGTIHDTAQQVTGLGGTGIAVPIDAGDDSQIVGLIDRISDEQGRLEILANSVWGGYERFTDGSDFNPGPFWEQPLSLWDSMHRIGVRAHYVTSALAAPLMINSGPGLIVNVSSFAGQVFVPPVPYGVAHAAIDRLARDMAEDLRPYQITSISLYPGARPHRGRDGQHPVLRARDEPGDPAVRRAGRGRTRCRRPRLPVDGPVARGRRSRRIVRGDR